jgi:hypothetical protein
MTDDDFMIASPADCKSDVILLAAQDEISIVIDDDGNMILRQQDALGNSPDTISIARRNLATFVSDLIDFALPECSFPPRYRRQPAEGDATDIGGTGTGTKHPARTSDAVRRTSAAERQSRYRQRKRGEATGGPPTVA